MFYTPLFLLFLSVLQLNKRVIVHTSAMSVASGIAEFLLRLSGASREISEKNFYKLMRRKAIKWKRGERSAPRFCGVKVEREVYCGMPYFVFVPPEVDTAKCVMYLHGSGYVNNYRRAQVRLAAEIAENTHAKVYFPLYVKLPFCTVLPCFALLNNYFAFLRKRSVVCLAGDSSGAALALSLAAEHRSVRSVVAISPWLRLPVGEEGRKVKSDKMLSFSKLDFAARLWREGVTEEDVRVSPIFGEYAGKKILLFAGEKEIFRPDALTFFREKSSHGATVTYVEGRGQQHCYPLMQTPEGRAARRSIFKKIRMDLYGEGQ